MKAHIWLSGIALIFLSLLFGGCDGLTDDDGEDFDPAEGKGALFINNDSFNRRVLTFIDGDEQPGRAGTDRTRVYELDPGTYRVMLVDDETDRVLYREEVDILLGRVLVLDVTSDDVVERLE